VKIALLGASGRTGRLILERALAAGHSVRALARSPAKLDVSHDRLEVIAGDASDRDAVRSVVDGCDVVISALGPSGDRSDVCSAAAEHVIAAGATRYVSISGAGIDVPGDDKDLIGKIVSFMVRTLAPAAFRDKVREHALLEESSVAWTLVRPPRLLDGPARGRVRTSLVRSPGASIPRSDLAEVALEMASNDSMIGRAPFVAT
jgi:putative NADH-flavin reductase